MTDITVVYSTDYNYLKYAIVSMYSLMKNIREDCCVNFVLLVPPDMPDSASDLITSALSGMSRYTVKLVRVEESFDKAHMAISHITVTANYRLLLPVLLPEVSKCIYIDCDTIVTGDVAPLFAEPIGDDYVAGVKAYTFYRNELNTREALGFTRDEEFVYINSGVLLLNLEAMRKDDVTSKFMSLINNEYQCLDQDIINVACKGKIRCLPMRYNVMTKYVLFPYKNISAYVSEDEFSEACERPVVVHFADKEKPWNNPSVPWAEKWFEYCLAPDVWAVLEDDERSVLINSICESSGTYKKEKLGVIAYLRKFGFKYAVRRFLSGMR